MAPFRKLIVQFSHFVGGSMLTILLGFITFPILTRLLTREEYGVLGLVTTTASIAVAFAKGGLSDGIIRFYREYADSRERQAIFTSTVVLRGALFSVIVVFCYLFLIPRISHYIGIGERFLTSFFVMAIYLFFRPLNIIVLNYLRAQGITLFYNVINVSTRALSITFGLGLMLLLVHDLWGYFLGVALAELLAGVVLYRWLLKRYQCRPQFASKALALDLIRFGLPLLLTELLYLVLAYIDRYMIVAFHGEDLLGLYSVGYNLPSYINELVMFSLSYAVVPIYTELYTTQGRVKTEEFLSRSLHFYIAAVIPICGIYAAVSRDLLVALASPKYAEAAAFSPIVLSGLIFLGMNSIISAGLYVEKRSTQLLGIMFAAVVVNISMNLILLPTYRGVGAALATLAACIVSSGLTAVLAFRYLRVRFDLRTVAYYLATTVGIYFVLLPLTFANVWVSLFTKGISGLLLAAAAMLWREDEVRVRLLAFVPRRT